MYNLSDVLRLCYDTLNVNIENEIKKYIGQIFMVKCVRLMKKVLASNVIYRANLTAVADIRCRRYAIYAIKVFTGKTIQLD